MYCPRLPTFKKIPKNALPLSTRNFPKSKPEFLVERKESLIPVSIAENIKYYIPVMAVTMQRKLGPLGNRQGLVDSILPLTDGLEKFLRKTVLGSSNYS